MKFRKELDQSLRILFVFAVISTVFELVEKFSPVIIFRGIRYVSKDCF